MFVSDNAAKIPGVTTTPGESPDLLIERGKRLRERIDELGLSQGQAGRLVGIKSRTTVLKILKGDAPADQVLKLEQALADYEAHPGDGIPEVAESTTEGLMEIELEDVSGTDWRIGRIVARSSTPDAREDLIESVAGIIGRLREKESDPGI